MVTNEQIADEYLPTDIIEKSEKLQIDWFDRLLKKDARFNFLQND